MPLLELQKELIYLPRVSCLFSKNLEQENNLRTRTKKIEIQSNALQIKQEVPKLGPGLLGVQLGGQSQPVLVSGPLSTPEHIVQCSAQAGGWDRGRKWFETEIFKSLSFLSSLFHFISGLLHSISFPLSGITEQKPFTQRKVLFCVRFWVEYSIPNIHPFSHKENETRS